jgi:NHL repeat-containing protein
VRSVALRARGRYARVMTAVVTLVGVTFADVQMTQGDGTSLSTFRGARMFTLAGQPECSLRATPPLGEYGGKIATSVRLGYPTGASPLPDGGILIAEAGRSRIRRITARGTITTIAGRGVAGYRGDGGRAVAALLNHPQGVTATPAGGLVIADTANHRIRVVSSTGRISTLAGDGVAGSRGDGGAARRARFSSPTSVVVQPDGAVLVVDSGNSRVRRIGTDGVVRTVAGGGRLSSTSAAVRSATDVRLPTFISIAALPDNGFLFTDPGRGRILRASADGSVHVAAGGGTRRGLVDGIAATAARLGAPTVISSLPTGGFTYGDERYGVLRTVSAQGIVTTIAGDPRADRDTDSGDGGPARRASFGGVPKGETFASFTQLASTAEGGVVVAEPVCGTVRYVSPVGSTRLGLAMRAGPTLTRRAYRLTYVVSRPARVRVEIARRDRPVTSFTALVGAGAHTVRRQRTFSKGTYGITVTARDASGQIASRYSTARVM